MSEPVSWLPQCALPLTLSLAPLSPGTRKVQAGLPTSCHSGGCGPSQVAVLGRAAPFVPPWAPARTWGCYPSVPTPRNTATCLRCQSRTPESVWSSGRPTKLGAVFLAGVKNPLVWQRLQGSPLLLLNAGEDEEVQAGATERPPDSCDLVHSRGGFRHLCGARSQPCLALSAATLGNPLLKQLRASFVACQVPSRTAERGWQWEAGYSGSALCGGPGTSPKAFLATHCKTEIGANVGASLHHTQGVGPC